MDAVAGDQRGAVLVGAIGEVGGDVVFVLGGAGAGPAGEDAIAADCVLCGVEQHALEVAAVDGDLRVGEAGELAGGFAPDKLAEAVEEGAFLGHNAGADECRFEAKAREFGHAVRHDVDADADFADFAGGIRRRGRGCRRDGA